jgi:hypothetical protein
MSAVTTSIHIALKSLASATSQGTKAYKAEKHKCIFIHR